jgi:hypothetical protein
MPVVDADAHIDGTDETWEYMDEEFVKYKPITVTQTFGEAPPILPWGYNRYWFVGGKIRVRRYRDDVRTASTTETRELLDVQERLAQLDELGIDVQVIYPTSFLMAMSEKPEVEAALRKSYNRWMAKKQQPLALDRSASHDRGVARNLRRNALCQGERGLRDSQEGD